MCRFILDPLSDLDKTKFLNIRETRYSLELQKRIFENVDLRKVWNDNKQKKKEIKKELEIDQYKILDAPWITDDFYSDILDMNEKQNIMIALDDHVYSWNANNVKFILDVDEKISSLKIHENNIALCLNKIYMYHDVEYKKTLRKIQFHSKLYAMTNRDSLFTFSNRGGDLVHVDIRQEEPIIERNIIDDGFCGALWSDRLLALGHSSGDVLIKDIRFGNLAWLQEHVSSVKAMAWLPYRDNYLATAGGSDDKTLCYWNLDGNITYKKIQLDTQLTSMTTFDKYVILGHGYKSNGRISVWDDKLQNLETFSCGSDRTLNLVCKNNLLAAANQAETLTLYHIKLNKLKNDEKKFNSINYLR